MACLRCSSDKVVRFAYFDSARSLRVCEVCGFSQEVVDDAPVGDGCMDDVQVELYCSKPAGPSQGVSAAGNSNRMFGLLRTPPKGVM